MYGYVRPNIPELKVREKLRYDAWYCGLCRSIGKRYSLTSRLVLSYDSAFLAMLVSDVCGFDSVCEKHTCPIRPIGAKKVMVKTENPALDFAADVCVILAEFKLKDDVADGKRLRGAARLPLLRAFRKAKANAPELHDAVQKGIERLSAIEKARAPSLDLAANAFGELMRDMLLLAPLPQSSEQERAKTRTVLGEIGYWLGRTIYFMDAWDDRAEDEKRKTYNPFILSGATEEDAEFAVNYSINSLISAYDLLERTHKTGMDGAIEDNVFYIGLFGMWDSVKSGKTERAKRFKRNGGANIDIINEKERVEGNK